MQPSRAGLPWSTRMPRQPAPPPDYAPLRAFLADCTERHTPPTTLKSLRLTLSQMVNWYEDETGRPFRLEDVSKADIEQWMVAGDVAPATSNRRKAAWRSWAAWARGQRLLRDDPSQDLADLAQTRKSPRSVSREAVDAILREARKEPDALLLRRNEALLELLAFNGVRVQELCDLAVADLNLAARSLHIREGKGGKERWLALRRDSVPILDRYLGEARFPNGVPRRNSAAAQQSLWFRREGSVTTPGLSQRSVQELVKSLTHQAADLARADAEKARRRDQREGLLFLAEELETVTPHVFRHSLARRMIEDGVPLPEVQAILGHASIVTTSVYTKPHEDSIRAAIEVGGDLRPRRKTHDRSEPNV